MVTIDILHRLSPNRDIEAVRSAVRRMVNLGYVQAEPLDTRRVYYRLTPLGARLIAASHKYAQPLKIQGKIQRYAVSWFIHADHPGQRAVLNPTNYPDQFPVTGHRLPRCPFFLDRADGHMNLGIILVDHNAHHRRMSHKTVRLLRRFLRHGWFDSFIRQDAFVVAILTFAAHRSRTFQQHVPQAITDHLGDRLSQVRLGTGGAMPPSVQVHIIPGLDAIIAMDRKTETKT
jgi:DNA-binding MarR family transcriptional regulator